MNHRRRAAAFGARAEQVAARLYEARGYKVVERNWRTPRAEVDLVVRRGPLLVFVEVKARGSEERGTAAEAVDPAKRRRILEAARAYLAKGGADLSAVDVRFDVVLVRRSEVAGLSVECIPGAFDSSDEGT